MTPHLVRTVLLAVLAAFTSTSLRAAQSSLQSSQLNLD